MEQYETGSTFIRDYRREDHDREVRGALALAVQHMWDSGDDGATNTVEQGKADMAGGEFPPPPPLPRTPPLRGSSGRGSDGGGWMKRHSAAQQYMYAGTTAELEREQELQDARAGAEMARSTTTTTAVEVVTSPLIVYYKLFRNPR